MMYPQHDTACVSDMSVIWIIFFINCLSIIVKSMKSTYGIYCNIIPLETCKEICICTTEFHCIMFDIDQEVILTWQIIEHTSITVYCRNLIDRNKCLHKKIINYI